MKLSDLKSKLNDLNDLRFIQPDGRLVPVHFHITEAGLTTKHFIDCGGTVRTEKVVNFQLWEANDTDHRLKPQKLASIISLSEKVLPLEDLEVELEYQTDTIGRYGLDFDGKDFQLVPKRTDCLAKDNCGMPAEKVKKNLPDPEVQGCCTPGSACC